jgi:hypothetical protein
MGRDGLQWRDEVVLFGDWCSMSHHKRVVNSREARYIQYGQRTTDKFGTSLVKGLYLGLLPFHYTYFHFIFDR